MPIPYIPPSNNRSASGALPYVPGQAPPAKAPAPPAPPAPKVGDGALGEFSGNAVRAVASPLLRTAGAIDSVFGNKSGANFANNLATKTDAGADKTTAGKAGTVVGEVAPYMIPVGGEEKITADVLAKTGSKIAGKIAGAAPQLAANTAIGTAQTGDLKKGAISGVEALAGQKVVGAIASKVGGVLSTGGKSIRAAGQAEGRLKTVSDMISPKATKKEIQLAMSEGRIAVGQDPTILRDGTPDQILPSKETERASATVLKKIPDAHTLKQPQLYTALDHEIKTIATKLKPEMEQVPITPATVQKITDSWTKLKAKQISDPYIDATANVEKLQAQFEKDFLQKSKAGNLNDLWETRIAYDSSVPSNVKEATSMSPDKLQTQKSLWLQNRGILNDAINDSTTGLGAQSQKAFSEMSDLYGAQKGIRSSYALPKEGAASKAKQFSKSPAGRVIEGALGGTAVYEVSKKLGAPLP
jgi:hypothetical protein